MRFPKLTAWAFLFSSPAASSIGYYGTNPFRRPKDIQDTYPYKEPEP